MADTPSRRRARIVVGAVIAAAALGVGGVAAADIYTAGAARVPSMPRTKRLGGPGEKLDPTAPDYGTVIDEETTDIPFPSDEARQISRADLVADGRRDEPGSASVSTGAMRFWTARAAQCAWANEWVVAWEAGDDAASAEAAAMLVASPLDWPAVTDVDPK